MAVDTRDGLQAEGARRARCGSRQSRALLTQVLLLSSIALGSPVFAQDAKPNAAPQGESWARHAIEDRLFGSDGTRLKDVDGDGLPDVVASWENAKLTGIYFHPGYDKVRERWPSVIVGSTPDAEEALLVDLDNDGRLDVVSSQERGSERVVVYWGPSDPAKLRDPLAWKGEAIPATQGLSMWMYAEPLQLDGRNGVDLVIGGKNYEKDQSAELGWLEAPVKARDLAAWKWHELAKVSWVMSIEIADMNGDGFKDILYTDKNGPGVGAWWLERPRTNDAAALARPWTKHRLTPDPATLAGAMFLTIADLDEDGLDDVLSIVDYPRQGADQPDNERRAILWHRRLDASGLKWETHRIAVPPGTGQPKGIAVGDIDRDGRNEIVMTSTGAVGDLIGTYYLKYGLSPTEPVWTAYNIAGPQGVKYDVVHLVDLDGDGDLDVLTNDEKEGGAGQGLGVIWYENRLPAPIVAAPLRKR